MKNLIEKIYENYYGDVNFKIHEDFFDNMVPFDNTPVPVEYYTLKKRGRNGEWLIYKTDRVGNRVQTTISKDAALLGIDKLSDLILKIDSNPGSKNSMYDLNEYLKDEGKNRVFKYYTAGAIKKIIAKLCEDPSNNNIIKNMYSSPSLASYNVQVAFGMAALKANDIIPKNFRYADLNKNDMETAEIGLYMETALICMGYDAGTYDLPLSAGHLSAKFAAEQAKYDAAIYKLDELKADVTTLRDNGYPFNAMIEKTMNDIDSRHRVIAKLASKF